jgi:transcription elongation factor GreA
VADVGKRTASAVDLVRTVGLLPDGPVRWGSPARSARPGVYLVELPAPLPRAPVDLSPVGSWIDRVPTLQLDGHRPAGKELAQRLAGFWLPDQIVLYVGSTAGSLGRRIQEMVDTPLGDAAPHPDGGWLKTLHGLDQARVWWAETSAPEEYADAILAAFADAVDPAVVANLHDPTVVVPFANMATPTGLQKDHGITGQLLDAPAPPQPAPPRRVVTLPPGNAVSSEAGMAPRARATGGASRRAASTARAGAARAAVSTHPRAAVSTQPRAAASAATSSRGPEPVHVTAEGLAKLREELDELVTLRRPEIIARVRAARELGDLSENADYEAARKEQSFAEGRIAQLEAMIRHASIIEAPTGGDEVVLGSTVVVESPEGEETYTIVGTSEARPAEGRISNTSPIGIALLGRHAGDEVVVRAPAGDRRYRIRELR